MHTEAGNHTDIQAGIYNNKMHIHIHTGGAYIQGDIHTGIDTYTHTYTHTYLHTYSQSGRQACILTSIYILSYRHTTYTRAHTHAYTYREQPYTGCTQRDTYTHRGGDTHTEACTYEGIYIQVQTTTHRETLIHTDSQACREAGRQACIHIYKHTYAYTYIHTPMHRARHTYHTHTYIYTAMHIHAYIYTGIHPTS